MSQRPTLPSPPPTLRHLTNAQIEGVNLIFPKVRKYWCPTCQDTKVFKWFTDPPARDLTDLSEYDCDCASQFLLYRRYLYSGILGTYQRLDWYDLVAPEAVDSISACLEYSAKAESRIQMGLGLTIWGGRGIGKTLVANLLAKELLLGGHDVYVQTFHGMLEVFSEGWKDDAKRKWFHERIRSASVLVVDELGREGKEGTKGGDMAIRTLEQTLRYRVQSSFPTIFTSNFNPDQVEAGYGGHTVSLLSEKNTPVQVLGSDYRRESRKRSEAESDAGLTRPVLM